MHIFTFDAFVVIFLDSSDLQEQQHFLGSTSLVLQVEVGLSAARIVQDINPTKTRGGTAQPPQPASSPLIMRGKLMETENKGDGEDVNTVLPGSRLLTVALIM